jgi:hypothetical protein
MNRSKWRVASSNKSTLRQLIRKSRRAPELFAVGSYCVLGERHEKPKGVTDRIVRMLRGVSQ